MADEVIGLDLELRLEGAQSVRELKQIIKDAKNEAVKFGEGTKEFDKFAKIAGHATDQIGDLNERIKALDPGEKAKAFHALGSTIVGGMQAATGALAVFSGDNEQLNAILLKSMAIVQGLQGIQAIADAKKQLGSIKNILGIGSEVAATEALTAVTVEQGVATTATAGASKLLRGALIATGIGAIVVLVGLLIANWDKITASFKGFDKVANEFKAVFAGMWEAVKVIFANIGKGAEIIYLAATGQFGKALDATKEFQSVSQAYQKGHEEKLQEIAQDAANKILEKRIKHNKDVLNIMRGGGKDTYDLQRKIFQDELSLLDKHSDDYAAKLNEIAVLDAEHKKELFDKAKDAKEKQQKLYDDEDKRVIAAKLKENEDFWKSEDEKDKKLKDAADLKLKEDQEIADAQAETDKKSLANFAKSQDDKKAKAQATQDAMFQIAQWGANGIIAIGQLMTNNAKKQEVYNKIAAGIQIGIDTARGITSAVAAAKGLTGFDYVAQVALGVGTVLANAAKAKQLLSKAGGSTPNIDTGTIGSAAAGAQMAAPSFTPTNQRTLLEDAERRRESGKKSETTVKAYVVESEMTESQKRIAQLQGRRIK